MFTDTLSTLILIDILPNVFIICGLRNWVNISADTIRQRTEQAATKAVMEYWNAIPREERKLHFDEMVEQTNAALV